MCNQFTLSIVCCIILLLVGCVENDFNGVKSKNNFYDLEKNNAVELVQLDTDVKLLKSMHSTGDSILIKRVRFILTNKVMDTIFFRVHRDNEIELVPNSFATKENGNWGINVCGFMNTQVANLLPKSSRCIYMDFNSDIDSIKLDIILVSRGKDIRLVKFFKLN